MERSALSKHHKNVEGVHLDLWDPDQEPCALKHVQSVLPVRSAQHRCIASLRQPVLDVDPQEGHYLHVRSVEVVG